MLVKCKECGKEISDQAITCPHCGAPTPKVEEDKDKKKGSCLYAIFIVIVLFVVGLVLWDVGVKPQLQVNVELQPEE